MRGAARVWVGALALLGAVAACGSGTATPTGTSLPSASTTPASVGTSISGSQLRVTVPALESSPAAVSGSTEAAPASEAVESSQTTAAAVSPQTYTAALTAPPPAPSSAAAGTAVSVELVDCEGCAVIATRANVTVGFSAALITRDGRASLLSLDGDGAVRGIINVVYGSAFTAPDNGVLACGAGARCAVVGTLPDGLAVLSVFELTESGAWRDLSGDSGFVSATAKGGPVWLEDSLGVAIQDSDGASTVWMVLSWTGQFYTVLGCAPDADSADLTALSVDTCLS